MRSYYYKFATKKKSILTKKDPFLLVRLKKLLYLINFKTQ